MDAELARTLAEWKLAQKPERKQPDALVVSTRTAGAISASNFLARDFYPALEAVYETAVTAPAQEPEQRFGRRESARSG